VRNITRKSRTLFVYFAIMSVIIFSIEGTGYSDTSLMNISNAETLMNRYFELLSSGDVAGVLAVLEGPMYKKNEMLLKNNPSYVGFLKERYRSVSFVITGHELLDGRRLALNVLIRPASQEEIESRFVLVEDEDRIKIFSEEEIVSRNHKIRK
jgi:hypothetical protein